MSAQTIWMMIFTQTIWTPGITLQDHFNLVMGNRANLKLRILDTLVMLYKDYITFLALHSQKKQLTQLYIII